MGKLKVLITGGNGYIGKSLYNFFEQKYEVTLLTRKEFDLTNPFETNKWFKDKSFDVLIHTAINGGSRLKIDDYNVMDQNLKMFYNLLNEKNKFKKFINLGSGAETNFDSPYGISKYIIKKSILEKKDFFNIRIFGLFDENELSTRFIKGNLIRYLNREEMIIYENKKMDFFYMKDFIKLIEFFMLNNDPPKEINCSYPESFSLLQIVEFINSLDSYKVKINGGNKSNDDYVGEYSDLNLKLIGLFDGIRETYKLLKNKTTNLQ